MPDVMPTSRGRSGAIFGIRFDAPRKRGVPTAYVPFEGEQHGFRKAENICRALEGELYFFARVLGFETADAIPPVPIENL